MMSFILKKKNLSACKKKKQVQQVLLSCDNSSDKKTCLQALLIDNRLDLLYDNHNNCYSRQKQQTSSTASFTSAPLIYLSLKSVPGSVPFKM